MNLIPLFAYGTLGLQILGGFLILLLFVRLIQPKDKFTKNLAVQISKKAILISFITASVATFGSLYLSEIRGFEPCKLCWFQRIFMYPQVIVLGLGYYVNDMRVRLYSLALSIVGLGIAVYHILVQFLPGVFQCTDEIAKCSAKQSATFGYLTIPVMSATVFGFISIILLFTFLRSNR